MRKIKIPYRSRLSFLCGLVVFILLPAYASLGYSQQTPEKTVWLDDRYSALYPENIYLIGVGKVQIIKEEYPEKKADTAAKADLTDKISAMLKQTAVDIFRDKTPQEITDITEIAAKETVKIILARVMIGARWIEKKDNSLYSLAVVKYSEVAQSIDKRSEKVNSSAEEQYKLAEKYFKKRKLFSAIQTYIQTLQTLDKFDLYSSMLQSLQDTIVMKKRIKSRKVFISTVKIEEKVENIISALSLEKLKGDTQEVSSGVLPQHITVKILHNAAPASDFPVNVSLPDGNAVYTPNIRSDDKGVVKCDISNINEGKKINRVIVTPDLPVNIEGRESSVTKWQKQLSKKQVEFTYFIFSPKELREWIDDVALSIAKQAEKYGKLSIIVEDFDMNDGAKNKLCKYFPEILASQLSSIGREHLTVKRIVEVKKKRKEFILTGMFTEVGSGVTVSVRLDNYKGEYLVGSSITAQRTDEINNLLREQPTEPVEKEALPGPTTEKQPEYSYEFEEGVESAHEKEEVIEEKSQIEEEKKEELKHAPVEKEEIKEKPHVEEKDEEEKDSIIRLEKKKEEFTTPKKRKRPRLKIID